MPTATPFPKKEIIDHRVDVPVPSSAYVHVGDADIWISSVFNPIFQAGSHLVLELMGLRNYDGTFLPIAEIDEDLDDFGNANRKDQFHTLVYEVRPVK